MDIRTSLLSTGPARYPQNFHRISTEFPQGIALTTLARHSTIVAMSNNQIKTNLDYFNDGGRYDAGFKGMGNCLMRAVAISCGNNYRKVWDSVKAHNKRYYSKINSRTGEPVKRSPARGPESYRLWMMDMGFERVFNEDGMNINWAEIPLAEVVETYPNSIIITKRQGKSTHAAAIVDGVYQDTYDSTKSKRSGKVYLVDEVWVKS